MKSWDELSEVEQLACMFSDFYKDVHGVRPRFDDESWTAADYQREIDSLQIQCKAQMAEEQERQQEAIAKFEKHVINTICMGAGDRETAIRWIMDASEAANDPEYFCFLNGLPYGYFKEVA